MGEGSMRKVAVVAAAIMASTGGSDLIAQAGQGERAYPAFVNAEIESSIDRGLRFLARTQNRDGSWRDSGSYGSYPISMTALAGMALIGSGSSSTRGRYWRQVRRATRFLMAGAQPNGVITSPQQEQRSMYGHGFATMFLAQVYGMEEDPVLQLELHRVLTKAVELIVRSQSSYGGWYYSPDSGMDEGSVTVTQLQALRACRNAGIAVPSKCVDRAVQYIAKSKNPDGGIRYGARSGGASRPAITAAAVAVLYFAGRYDDPMADKAFEYARRTLPIQRSRGHHYYAHLYLAQAAYQKGGKDWSSYFPQMAKWLLGQQRKDGSWVGDSVGSTYGTAIALTILQLPYALIPIYQR